ncbi:hypothetical protein FO519_010249 [Halicephalobus sp. NKZ332]|nr:hypothetical protein FO519_010249 [Halicephalobus sp. NKZ332]
MACNAGDIELVSGTGVQPITLTATVSVAGANGALTMTVICDVTNVPGAFIHERKFKDGLGGPVSDQRPQIVANLVSTDGHWTFKQNDLIRVITAWIE